MIFLKMKDIALHGSTIIQLIHLLIDFALGMFIAHQIIKKLKTNLLL